MAIIGEGDQLITFAVLAGTISVKDPNSGTRLEFPNYIPSTAHFAGNRIIWPVSKPIELVPFQKTEDSSYATSFGMSYLKYWFYMKTEDAHPAEFNNVTLDPGTPGEYDKLFLEGAGYIMGPVLTHSGIEDREWSGVWRFDSVNINNIKGNLSKVDVQISRQIYQAQIVDVEARQK